MPTTSSRRRKSFATLGEAVEDCHLTVGTTCRGGPYREAVRPLRESAIELAEASAANRIAMIFGAEDTGLTNRELKFCQTAHHDSDLRSSMRRSISRRR